MALSSSRPFRVPCRFGGVDGYVVLDQLRSVDETRLVKRIGSLTAVTLGKTLAVLRDMFAA